MFYDTSNSPLSLSGNDAYQLDGLRLIKESSTSSLFLKEIDDFSRISIYGTAGTSPLYFKVQQKDGTKLYYGNYLSTNAYQKSTASNDYIAWYLAVQEDVHGNYIKYQYDQDTTNGDVWLTSITYTLRNGYNFQHENKVLFSYKQSNYEVGTTSCPDYKSGFINGSTVNRKKVLTEITALTDNDVMRRYTLEYIKPTDSYSNKSPRLHRITEYGEGGTTALNPMYIQWGNGGQRILTTDQINYANVDFISGDFNGDGMADLLSIRDVTVVSSGSNPPITRNYVVMARYGSEGGLSNELLVTTFNSQYAKPKAYTGDFDGDGLDDIFFRIDAGYKWWKSSFPSSGGNIPIYTQQSYFISTTNLYELGVLTMADINNDGKDELVIHNKYYKHGSTSPMSYTLYEPTASYQWTFGDFDADGTQDIILYTSTGYTIITSISKNTKLLEKDFAYFGMISQNNLFLIGHFNNDCYLDFILTRGYSPVGAYDITHVSQQARIFYYTGKDNTFTYNDINLPFSQYHTYKTGDFNGDGLTDLACEHNYQIDGNRMSGGTEIIYDNMMSIQFAPNFTSVNVGQGLYLSPQSYTTASGLGSAVIDDLYMDASEHLLYHYPVNHHFIVVDVTGDGKSDIINICKFNTSSNPVSVKMVNANYRSTSDVVTNIVNGDGTKRSITYKLPTGVKQRLATYDFSAWYKSLPTFNVVNKVTLGTIYTDSLVENIKYTFSKPAYGKKANRFFQGFSDMIHEDLLTGIKTTNGYNASSYMGYPIYNLSTKQIHYGSTQLFYAAYSMNGIITASNSSGSVRYSFPYMISSSEYDYLKGIRIYINYIYDTYGNQTRKSTIHASASSSIGSGGEKYLTENMSYVACSSLSSFPGRMSSYSQKYMADGDTITYTKNFTYNSYGDLLTETSHNWVKSYAYNTTLGFVTSDVLTAGGQSRTNTYEYDDARYAKKVTNPVGLITQCTRDVFGNLLTETMPDGLTTTYQYDVFGRLRFSTSPDNIVSETRYLWASSTSPLPTNIRSKKETYYDNVLFGVEYFDSYGRSLQTSTLQSGGKWQHTQNTYDVLTGRLVQTGQLYGSTNYTPISTTSFTYDNYGRIASEHYLSANNGVAANQEIYYTYAPRSETKRTVAASKERTETTLYNFKWKPISYADTLGVTTYTYNAADQLTAVSSPGYPVSIAYNTFGLRTSLTNAASGTTTYTYNAFDELISETNGNNQATTWQYDAAGRITSTSDANRTISYTYNNQGQLTTESRTGYSTVYTYNTLGKLSQETKTIQSQSFTKSYTYDNKGRLYTYTSPSGLVQRYNYNTWHDLISITDNATSTKLWEAVSYGEHGWLTSDRNIGNRISTYTYDIIGRYTNINNNLGNFAYQYNAAGQLTQRVENFQTSGLSETFTYNVGGCLTSSALTGQTPISVTYNDGASINTKSDVGAFTYGTQGAPMTQLMPVYGYSPSNQSITYYANNRPQTLTQGAYTATYQYGTDDKRDSYQLSVNGTTHTTRYYFDDFEQNIIHSTNAIIKLDYIFAAGKWVGIARTVDGTRTFYGVMTDRQGSLRALYNSGGLVQAFSYDAWGNRRNIAGSGNALNAAEIVAVNSVTSRGYTGHEHIDEFGLINMNARIYDPKLGMFISVDPQAERYYSTYSYTYCGGDPLNGIDPSGEAWKPTYTEGHDGSLIFNGYEWVEEEDSYDEDGNLKSGLYAQALFFSHNGTFDSTKYSNIGSSTLTVYLADGTTLQFAANTMPSSSDYAMVPEGIYHATVGKHKGSYIALRMSDINNSGRIELGTTNPNPKYKDGRTYADGINIHKPGLNNLTGMTRFGDKPRPISEGCLLIDRNQWENFIKLFDNESQRKNRVSVTVSRTLSAPINANIVPAFNFFMNGTRHNFFNPLLRRQR
jgi:RHS repeat-associated protein